MTANHGFSETQFVCWGASNGHFEIEDAEDALRGLVYQDNLDETQRNLLSYSKNTLKILLGIALIFSRKDLFD